MGHDAAKRRAFGGSADPPQLAAVEPYGFIAERLTEDVGAIPNPYKQAVRLGAAVRVVRCNEAPGAGHIFNNDCRVAGNMFANVASDDPSRKIVASAGGEPHHKADRLTLIKLISVRRANSKREQRDSD